MLMLVDLPAPLGPRRLFEVVVVFFCVVGFLFWGGVLVCGRGLRGREGV